MRHVASELSRRGHRVLVLAPSRSQERVRASRRTLRAAREQPQSLLEGTDGGEPRVIAVGEVLDVPTGASRPTRALPIDVARTVEELLGTTTLDFVHVHEPFAPSAANAALRHSRALNVGSFHAPTERLLSTILGRRFVATFFGRLDARTASAPDTAELMDRHFPADYRLVAPGGPGRQWGVVTDELERLYRELAARRRDPHGDPELRRRLTGRPTIDVDLHMHTDHSHDCATPVEVLLATAREQGLGAIAVTDHNEVSGALEARELAAAAGVKVVVGEEVKTASQGEVIGLFLEERIPRGLTLAETVAEIKRQGGVVYVPHPFDRMHAVPDYEHLLASARGGRRDRGVQPTRGDRGVQRGGRPLRGQVPDRGGRRLGRARRPGPRLGAGADARLRGSAGVPAVPARRRDRDAAHEPAVRAGAEVPGDPRHPALRAGAPCSSQGAASHRRRASAVTGIGDEVGATHGAASRTSGRPVKTNGVDARDRRRDPREVPGARDPRAEHAHARSTGVPALPAGQPDAGARLGPPAGRRDAAQVRPAALGGRGGRRLLRPRGERADEVAQAPGRSTR